MGKRLQARAIEKTMAKAFNLGISEDSFEVLGMAVTIQNLSEEEWQKALETTSDMEDMEVSLQTIRHQFIARAIVEIDGVSFRGVSSVELDEVDESNEPIVLEKVEYLITQVFKTWPAEVHEVINAKFLDHTRLIENKAKNGIVFNTPQETPEDKFRSLLLEAKELQGQIPFDLSEKILLDTGFKEAKLQKSEVEETIREVRLSEVEAPSPAPVVEPVVPRVPLTKQPSIVIPEVGHHAQPAPPPQSILPPDLPPLPEMTTKQRELAQMEGTLPGENEVSKHNPVSYEEALAAASTGRGGINPRFRPISR